MHRTEGANNSSNLFVDGPPGTTVEEDWLNAVQEEIANVIEEAGLTLKTASTETQTQLKAAMDILYVARANAPATAASSGTAGQFAYDSSYIYVCIATDTWERVGIATW